MIQVRISAEALQDLNDGFTFYESIEEGLGDYFIACLKADIERLRIYGGIHRVVYRDYHRLLSEVFPYGVFYSMEKGFVVVWAVIDLRRDPDWIRRRLSE